MHDHLVDHPRRGAGDTLPNSSLGIIRVTAISGLVIVLVTAKNIATGVQLHALAHDERH
jgi:hypothetical protein